MDLELFSIIIFIALVYYTQRLLEWLKEKYGISFDFDEEDKQAQ